MPCRARRINDQMICGSCRKAWDANDPEPPPCAPAEAFEGIMRQIYANLGGINERAR